MIAARYIARSLAEHGRPELQLAVRLVDAGANPHRVARRHGLTDREVAGLPALVNAVRQSRPRPAHGHTGPDPERLA